VKDFASAIRKFHADLVVSRSFHLTLVAAPAARRCSVPYVAIDASNPQLDFRRNAGRFQSVKRWLIGQAYARAAAVVALSEGAARGIADFYHLPRSRVTMLSSSIDVEELTSLAAEAGPRLEPGCFHIVTVGRLVPEKGQRDLIDAAALLIRDGRVPNLRLHLIGDGPLRSDLERAARESGIGDAVRFAGFRRNPFSYVRQCEVFCLPSHYEGSPGALLEAMACGVPAVACDCESGPREMLSDGRLGSLVPVHDPASLAAAILHVAQHPEAARQTAAEAQRSVVQRYSTEVIIRRLESLFAEVLERDFHRAEGT
jgi:glycosyltransferase involved in cell wall biosynthesis